MNSIVTFEQAKKLKDIGFNAEVHRYFLYERLISSDDFDYNSINKIHYSAPTVSSALDWIREEKRIVCFVDVIYHPIEKKAMYLGKILSESGIIIQKKTSEYDTHPLAESALLDSLLDYLEKANNNIDQQS